jgi:hypothetical protein
MVVVFLFQNCGKSGKTYDYLNQFSSISPSTTLFLAEPTPTISCSLASSAAQVSFGQSATWFLSSTGDLPTGYKIFWTGTGSDVDGSNVVDLGSWTTESATQYSVPYNEGVKPGYYTISAQIQNAGGSILCTSNLSRIKFNKMCSISGPATGNTTKNFNMSFSSPSANDSSKISSVNWNYSFNGASALVLTPVSVTNGTPATYAFRLIQTGTYKLNAIAKDASGAEICVSNDFAIKINL